MSLERIKNTIIWKKTLESRQKDKYSSEREELRSALLKFREKTFFLVSRISANLPGLTQHDISHLDALWDTASLIVGENFPITPLEGFVLGGAILLHDSALCFEAYENGQNGVRKTLQWSDAYAQLNESNNGASKDEIKRQADFIALRQLHAVQAESLLERKWIDPDNGQEIFLLENQSLRKHLGKLIGEIAASHHWDIETLTSKLSYQQNVLPSFPREWRIDPVKLACILRCADAAHIDNERAPDFLHALLKRRGLSFLHWQAQNRLSVVDIDQSDPEKSTILFTSTIGFSEDEAESWYVAYDATCLVDKEIKACNSLLENRNDRISFQVKKVRGVESPESMSQYIKANGWKPCSAQVHVGNIERIIQNLAGEMLYGKGNDFVEIAIREIIQNARDAIHARKFIEDDFDGKIAVKIQKTESTTWLTIEDNGVGMSERVLTGPLLDFGTSFWTSSLVQSEFPGLRSSSFKSIGKFGIGFYSVFMVAEKVLVSTRRWNDGLSSIHQMKFSKGFSLRPIITKGTADGFGSSVSTQIKLELKPDIIPKDLMVEIKTNITGSSNFNVPIKDYIAAICAGLDVPVYYKEESKSALKIHESLDSDKLNTQQWLNDISFSEYQIDSNNKEYISKNVNRLRPIIDNGKMYGLAAINTQFEMRQNFLSIETIGGLAHSVHKRYGDVYIGYIDYNPMSAKREKGSFSANKRVIKKWAQDQLEELLKLNLNPIESYCAASALCHFNVDPSPLAQILISFDKKQEFVSIEQLAELSKIFGIAFLESDIVPHMETRHDVQDFDGYALIKPLTNSPFLHLKINDRIPEKNNSILDCVYRAIVRKGYIPTLTKLEGIAYNKFGSKINALILSSE